MNGIPQTSKTARTGVAGPEEITLGEKLVLIFRLPYLMGSFIWAFIFGIAVELVAVFVQNTENGDALAAILRPDITWQGVLYLLGAFLFFFCILLFIRFMRVQVKQAEVQLAALLPGGEADFHQAFRFAFSRRWHILFFLIFLGLGIPTLVAFESNVVGRIEMVFGMIFITFILSCMTWLYIGSIIGLYRICNKSMKLKAYREDSKMGTRPFAALCLSLSLTYFCLVALMIFITAIAPYDAVRAPTMILIEAFLVITGIIMFLLPAYRIHLRMQEEKGRQLSAIQSHFDALSHELKAEGNEDSLVQIKRILSLDMAYRVLQPASTWPFETSTLGKFAALSLSVIAALTARVVISALHL